MAMVSEQITAEVVEAQEFPELARRQQVRGVPKTVLNDGKAQFIGAQPKTKFEEEINKAL